MAELANSSAPVVGIGACLTGMAVRYDGKYNNNYKIAERLRKTLTVRPFCPEVGIGLGVPRPPIHVVRFKASNAVLDGQTHQIDYSESLRRYARKLMSDNADLCGYVLVKGSPSCGKDAVKRYDLQGKIVGQDAQGLFADELQIIDPLLPVEQDDRLQDPQTRNTFINCVYAYRDWKALEAHGLSWRGLADFSAQYKYLVMVRDMISFKDLEALLASVETVSPEGLAAISRNVIELVLVALRRNVQESSDVQSVLDRGIIE